MTIYEADGTLKIVSIMLCISCLACSVSSSPSLIFRAGCGRGARRCLCFFRSFWLGSTSVGGLGGQSFFFEEALAAGFEWDLGPKEAPRESPWPGLVVRILGFRRTSGLLTCNPMAILLWLEFPLSAGCARVDPSQKNLGKAECHCTTLPWWFRQRRDP